MAEVNQDLLQQLQANRASFEAAGPAFAEDVKLIDAKIKQVQGGEAPTVVEDEEDDDVGTGPFEGRTVAQLRNSARAKGLATSGSKEELVERLRG